MYSALFVGNSIVLSTDITCKSVGCILCSPVGLCAFGSPPPMSSRHRNLEPLGGGTRQYIPLWAWIHFWNILKILLLHFIWGLLVFRNISEINGFEIEKKRQMKLENIMIISEIFQKVLIWNTKEIFDILCPLGTCMTMFWTNCFQFSIKSYPR